MRPGETFVNTETSDSNLGTPGLGILKDSGDVMKESGPLQLPGSVYHGETPAMQAYPPGVSIDLGDIGTWHAESI
jgi:hypothetical protein